MSILQDFRVAGRNLIKRRGMSTIIILTLALGIGANVTQFAMFYGYMLRPLPFFEPERLVSLHESQPKLGNSWKLSSPLNLRDWSADATSLADLAAYAFKRFNLASDDRPERIKGLGMTANLFPLLGVEPMLGRHIRPDEDRPGAPLVALISHQLWQKSLGADPQIVGKTVRLNDRVYEIVGVMPEGFGFPNFTDLWTPLALDPEATTRDQRNLWVVARLADGAALDQAQSELETVAARLENAHPDTNTGWSVQVRDLRDEWTPQAAKVGSYAQLGAVGFVLLIVCANITNLMLALGVSRRQEVALRSALGASRPQLMRQFFAESLLFSALGGMLGTLLAIWGIDAVRNLIPVRIPYWIRFELEPLVLAYTIGIVLLTAFVIGLAPALRGTTGRLVEALKSGGATESSVRGSRVRAAMVVGEFALSLVLLCCALLMIKSFNSLQKVEVGFASDQVLSADLSLTGEEYGEDPQRRQQLAQRLTESLAERPEVAVAAVGDALPGGWDGFNEAVLEVEGKDFIPGEEPIAFSISIDQHYLETLEIPLLAGRTFTRQESEEGAGVVLINRSLASQLWPGEEALGRRLRLPEEAEKAAWLEVVGVVEDVEPAFVFGGFDQPTKEQLYLPLGRTRAQELLLAVRGHQDPAELAPVVRRSLHELDASVPLASVMSVEKVLEQMRWAPQFFSRTLTAFAFLALFIAAIGAYGLTAFSVSRRQREMGMRIALGAQPGQLERMVLREGQIHAWVGIALGLLVALPLMRLLSAILYGISSRDPQVFLTVIAILIGVAALASYLPARHAARTDPLRALRSE